MFQVSRHKRYQLLQTHVDEVLKTTFKLAAFANQKSF